MGVLAKDQPQMLLADDHIRSRHSRQALVICHSAIAFVRCARTGNLEDQRRLHLAGYAHVVGTLWPVDDTTARDIYRQLTRDGSTPPEIGHAAHALHHATRTLRDQHPDKPALWAGHTHIGP